MRRGTWSMILAILTSGAAALAAEQALDAPVIKAGDTWTYRTTTEKGAAGWNQPRAETAVSRVTASTIYFSVKRSDSTQPGRELFSGLDWSRARDVNGKETVVNRPLAFPLAPGKTWEIHYTEQHPNKAHRSGEWTNKYSVVGYESVDVPAGKFNALKIEAGDTGLRSLSPRKRWCRAYSPTTTAPS